MSYCNGAGKPVEHQFLYLLNEINGKTVAASSCMASKEACLVSPYPYLWGRALAIL